MEIALEGFRGFQNQEYVPVRPITVLVGENSAGKSSFLAAYKFFLDLLSERTLPSFNSDPFQLGTYDQIAHYRGGRAGRVQEFALRLRDEVTVRKSRRRAMPGKYTIEIELRFESIEAEATPTQMTIRSGEQHLQISPRNPDQPLVFRDGQGVDHSIRIPGGMLADPTDFLRYWRLFLGDLRFLTRSAPETQQESRSEVVEYGLERFQAIIDTLSENMGRRTHATAAIRSKPIRVYTPGLEVVHSEGSHVPYELAKAYRRRSDDPSWSELKKSIEEFGRDSGMFRIISVKTFGNSLSDPFQIQLSLGGPNTNIVDLGYGTSQVLPILYDIVIASPRSEFLIQQPEVHLHPKAQAALALYFCRAYEREEHRFVVETHSDFIVDRFRAEVGRDRLDPKALAILFFDRDRLSNSITEIKLDASGEPANPPASYREFYLREQLYVLGL